jgi:hypothetical protein
MGEVPYSTYLGSQTTVPGTLDLYATQWIRSNQLFWFALA